MAQDQFKEIAPRAAARSQTPQPQVSKPTLRSFDDDPGVGVSSGADRHPRPESLRPRSDSAIRTANHKLVIADVADRPMRNLDGSPVFSPDMAAAHFRSEPGASIAKSNQEAAAQAKAASADAAQQAHAGSAGADPALTDLAERLMGQVSEVKHLLQSHIAGNTWNQLKGVSPARAEMLKRLLAAGFSPALATSLLEELGDVDEDSSVLSALRQPLAKRMRTIDPMALFDEGGVFAFIGPTGVGKTTTVAKIAARCVMRFGRKSVSLLSTDTYRIGALEQLRVFGKILGLPVTALRDAEDLTHVFKNSKSFMSY